MGGNGAVGFDMGGRQASLDAVAWRKMPCVRPMREDARPDQNGCDGAQGATPEHPAPPSCRTRPHPCRAPAALDSPWLSDPTHPARDRGQGLATPKAGASRRPDFSQKISFGVIIFSGVIFCGDDFNLLRLQFQCGRVSVLWSMSSRLTS